jgi:hypothetical protein
LNKNPIENLLLGKERSDQNSVKTTGQNQVLHQHVISGADPM